MLNHTISLSLYWKDRREATIFLLFTCISWKNWLGMTKTLSLPETDLCMICCNVHQDVADFSSSKAAQKLQQHHYDYEHDCSDKSESFKEKLQKTILINLWRR